MRSGSVKILAIVVIVLFGVLYALNTADRAPSVTESAPLIPELKARLNDLSSVTITNSDGQVTIDRDDDVWRVRDKHGYPADTSMLRQLLLAIAEARKIEEKTANPSLYERLAVQHPGDDGGDGVVVAAHGPDFGFSVILGGSVQSDYRYARIPEDEQSWLIDRNPELPDAATGWLESEIVDVETAHVQSVEIRHADGERIRLHKENAGQGTFDVEEIPAGRELSYPTIVNSIAGALGNLTLEDVAAVEEVGLTATTNVTFETFDGLRIDIAAGDIDDETWIIVEASVEPREPAPAGTPSADDGDDSDTADTTNAADADDTADSPEAAGENDAVTDESTAGEEEAAAPEEVAAAINDRTAGWRYRIASYKADQLARRWDDLLKAKNGE